MVAGGVQSLAAEGVADGVAQLITPPSGSAHPTPDIRRAGLHVQDAAMVTVVSVPEEPMMWCATHGRIFQDAAGKVERAGRAGHSVHDVQGAQRG